MTGSSRTSREVRKTFLEYFRRNGHEVVPSSKVVPEGDATLLFTNAGMVQFKDVFLGKDKRSYTRATTAQKCIRMSGKHNDLENVGQTARHHTFFEMLGNFSFGDYFKPDAIRYAWDLLTRELELDPNKMVITVFGGEAGLAADDEARAIWRKVTGFSDARILGMGRADNFWQMGDTGPCGPCTEIHYCMGDMDPDPSRFGEEPSPDGRGWMEIWNLVFMQFNRDASGVLHPLPAPCVDTGAGLERMSAVVQGVTSNYDTDLLQPLVQFAAEIAGKKYTASMSADDVSMRVIADHARLTAMCLSEGLAPGNEKQGSGIRSVMRRAIRHGVRLGINEPFLHRVALRVQDVLGDTYPQLEQHRSTIETIALAEEELFRELLPKGMARIAKFDGWEQSASGKTMPGQFAHDLLATFGFPLDLTQIIGAEHGFVVDVAGFEAARDKHTADSRGARATIREGTEERYKRARFGLGDAVSFCGYESERASSDVAFLLTPAGEVDSLSTGFEGEVVTRVTPFYGESGGQAGDAGVIRTRSGGVFRVTDTQKPIDGLVVHQGVVEAGTIRKGDAAELEVDHTLRSATRRNHSATHLLHWALRKVLGQTVQQRGSKVAPDTLRFDYATQRPMTDAEIATVEQLVNDEILANLEVRTDVTDQNTARARGAMMIFEENYGDVVRMLSIGRESVELCGGTHAQRTGDIGLFKIVADEPLSRGVRRVVAVTGTNALQWVRELESNARNAAQSLRIGVVDLPSRVQKLLDDQRELAKQISDLKKKIAEGGSPSEDPIQAATTVGDIKILAARVPVSDASLLREQAESLRDRLGPSIVVLGAVTDDKKVSLVCVVSKDLTKRWQAGKLIKEISAVVGGGGGGRPDFAQAGGTQPEKLDEALARLAVLVG